MNSSTLASIRHALSERAITTSEIAPGPWEIKESGNMIGYVYVEDMGNDTYAHSYMCTDGHHVPLSGASSANPAVEYGFFQTESMLNTWTNKYEMENGVEKDYPGVTFTKFKCEEVYSAGW